MVSEKSYGVSIVKADKVFNSFKKLSRSLGVILSGDKGIGKSMLAMLVCMRSLKDGYPVIIMDACYPGIAIFIDYIDRGFVIFLTSLIRPIDLTVVILKRKVMKVIRL